VKTKILYFQGWEVNPLESTFRHHLHIWSTVPASADPRDWAVSSSHFSHI